MRKMNYKYICGIDPGTRNCGFAIRYVEQDYMELHTFKLHEAIKKLYSLHNRGIYAPDQEMFVFLEDARKWTYHKNTDRGRLQGAGAIKAVCTILEDFLIDNQIPYQLISPLKKNTKWTSRYFKKVTGYQGRTNQHTRDAGVLALQNPVLNNSTATQKEFS